MERLNDLLRRHAIGENEPVSDVFLDGSMVFYFADGTRIAFNREEWIDACGKMIEILKIVDSFIEDNEKGEEDDYQS